jgi:hypothetical protein
MNANGRGHAGDNVAAHGFAPCNLVSFPGFAANTPGGRDAIARMTPSRDAVNAVCLHIYLTWRSAGLAPPDALEQAMQFGSRMRLKQADLEDLALEALLVDISDIMATS